MSNRRPTGIKAELRTQYSHLADDQLAAEVARLRKLYEEAARKFGAANAVLRKRKKTDQRAASGSVAAGLDQREIA